MKKNFKKVLKKQILKKFWKKNFETKLKKNKKKKFWKKMLGKQFWKKKFWKEVKKKMEKILEKKEKTIWEKIFLKKFWEKNVGEINYKWKIFITKIYSNIDKCHTIFALLAPFHRTGRKTGSNENVCGI